MQALVYEGPGQIRFDKEREDPVLTGQGDAIIDVEVAGLCGSDLHPYLGREAAAAGVVAGHEAVGRVRTVAEGVRGLEPGTRVLLPFTTCCGACGPCRASLTARCTAGALFGWGPPDDPARALDGAQAARVRVPLAASTLIPVPDDLDDLTALLCSDNLPTAFEAVERSRVGPNDPLAVVGLGAVGLCAVAAARALGAGPVLAIDPVASRRQRAVLLGATTVAHPEEITGPAGVGAVVEASGSAAGQRLAFELTAPGGTCSVIAVQTSERFAFTPVEAYDRNVTVTLGRANVVATLPRVLAALASGRLESPAPVCVTHPDRTLREGPALYRRFADREEDLVKVAFRPDR